MGTTSSSRRPATRTPSVSGGRQSDLEAEFALILRAAGMKGWVQEHQFLPDRKFRFDFAWLDQKVAVEIHGGVYSGGRHVTGAGFTRDCEKRNLATLAGWRVLEFTGNQLRSDPLALTTIVLSLLAKTHGRIL